MKKTSPLVLMACLGGMAMSHAATVASYQFDGASGTPVSSDTDTNSTPQPFGVGSGINGSALRYSTYNSTTGNRSAAMFTAETNGTDEATTIAANDYWTFTVTAVTGTLNLDTLSFNHGGSVNIESTIFVRSSIDDFATTIHSTGAYVVSSGGGVSGFTPPGGSSPHLAVVNLASIPAYQNLTTVEFRIYGFDNSATTADTGGVRIDNVQLTTIPEPSTLLTAAIFSLIPITRRRIH
ncbi:hypothetical protein OVA24_02975 [Luteolibacter sp. SL250]|uniref:hypothetical protein n=1 Tax=Luteolibacter sp. SL250 TaxID=2995170 RepID=UPI0022706C38|nr:hypothetical protein [Luteolibacter sp. SL250]WAC20340.1 hypothetical protein OVA24_02975 [Luteolibacter sp. SL250]